MGLATYVGHRFLGIVLLILGAVGVMAGLMSGSMFFTIISVVVIIAASYFMKTQHH